MRCSAVPSRLATSGIVTPAHAAPNLAATVAFFAFALLFAGSARADVERIGPWLEGDLPGYSHPAPTGANRVLLVLCHAEANAAPTDFTSVMYGDQSLTQVVERLQDQSGSFSATAEIWALDEAGIQAASGSTIVATTSGAAETRRISSVFYQNVDQVDPFGPTGTDGENANETQTLAVALSGGELDAGDTLVANCSVRNDQSGDTSFTLQSGMAAIGAYTISGSPYLNYSDADQLADATSETASVEIANNGVGALAVTALNHVVAGGECGNSSVDPGEDCDDGNTADGDCCSSTCQYEPSGSACGDLGDTACDDPDTCDAAGVCQPNHEPPTTVCRADAGACDVEELCDGAGACPADGFEVAGTLCGNPGDGICDLQDTCDGSGVCTDNVEPPTTVCRADAGACDVEELCDGAGACPADVVLDGVPCNDNNRCNGTDMCEAGVCVHTNPLDCDDGNPCSDDYCSPTLGCAYLYPPYQCDDGNACTSGDTCHHGTCEGPPTDCDDGNSCTADSCDEITGCRNEPIRDCTPVPSAPDWGLPLLSGLLLTAGALLLKHRRKLGF
jgi:cysteine-rich repeat protein